MTTPKLVVYADGPDGPLPRPAEVERAAGLAAGEPTDLLLGWVVREPEWLTTGNSEQRSNWNVRTFLVGTGTRRSVASGTVRSVPTRLSAIPGLLTSRLKPDIVVVGAWRDGPSWRLAGSPGWAGDVVGSAGGVVIERWPGVAPPGRPALGECNVVGVFDRSDPPDPAPINKTGGAYDVIGTNVASLVPRDATLQWGPGSIGASVVAALRHPVRVHSGLVTDELAKLEQRGLLHGVARSAYMWGGRQLSGMLAEGRLELVNVSQSHDLGVLSRIERFVAVNTAIEIGLDGSVNVETAGGRAVAGPGGHPDFALGAVASPGGLSIVAATSTAAGKSTIVKTCSVVSTPRCDVDVVVTEHGVADLRDCTDAERASRLISIADPQHREALRALATGTGRAEAEVR